MLRIDVDVAATGIARRRNLCHGQGLTVEPDMAAVVRVEVGVAACGDVKTCDWLQVSPARVQMKARPSPPLKRGAPMAWCSRGSRLRTGERHELSFVPADVVRQTSPCSATLSEGAPVPELDSTQPLE